MKAATLLVAIVGLITPACTKVMSRPAAMAIAPAQPRVAVLNVQRAILSTEDGVAAAGSLQRKFEPDQRRLAGDQQEIQNLRTQLRDGTDSETSALKARIEALERGHLRSVEDARQKFESERNKVYKELTVKLMAIVGEYSRKERFEVVLDSSDPKTPILWRADETDITGDVIKLYDLKYH